MKKLTVIMMLLVAMSFCFAQSAPETPAAVTTPAVTTETPAPVAAKPETYVRADDEAVYASVLGDYEALLDQAKAAESDSERFVIYAEAEAMLLDSATMVPNTTQNGAFTISRVAPRTVPYNLRALSRQY